MRPQYIQHAFTALALIASLSFAACKSDTPTPTPTPQPEPQPVFPKPDVNPNATPYVTRVLEYMPAVGQFTNTLPEYEAGDTQEDMNRKALEYLKDNQRSLVTLGGWGGYIVVGFDHTILNVPGKRDFRVLGNAFFGNDNKEAYEGGSCEPGIIMVAYDANRNGRPDEDEWYEIEGSAHVDHTKEPWYTLVKTKVPGADLNFYRDFEMTYHRPAKEPESKDGWGTYIRWEDNKGNSGYKVKNQWHAQPYFPQWVKGDKLTFRGTRLPQNSQDQSGVGTYYVLYKFRYGYADNELNDRKDSAIDIDWAVDKKGRKVHLPGVDFIKIYTGVNQENGWLGECSTEISGITDLHLLKEDIPN
ncbi:PKD domain-containing protein [Porphyromonas sp.]